MFPITTHSGGIHGVQVGHGAGDGTRHGLGVHGDRHGRGDTIGIGLGLPHGRGDGLLHGVGHIRHVRCVLVPWAISARLCLAAVPAERVFVLALPMVTDQVATTMAIVKNVATCEATATNRPSTTIRIPIPTTATTITTVDSDPATIVVAHPLLETAQWVEEHVADSALAVEAEVADAINQLTFNH